MIFRHRSLFCVTTVVLGLMWFGSAPTVALAQTPLLSTEFTPGSWTLVLLPDTQLYSQDYPGLYTLQTHWIAKSKEKLNIQYVLHLGDITNESTVLEWRRARDSMREMTGVVPYAFVPGNHDYGPAPLGERRTRLNEYFPASEYHKWPSFGGALHGDMCNSYHLFTAGGIDWIVLALEFTPRDETVQWADEVLKKYPTRKAILVTHAYLYSDGTRYDFAAKSKTQEHHPHHYPGTDNANDGEQLWNKLVRKNNFRFVFCGHVGAWGPGLLASKNDDGNTVDQMVVDYQSRPLGGEAYLRLLEFQPDGKTIRVKSFSPLYGKFLSDPNHQYSFEMDEN